MNRFKKIAAGSGVAMLLAAGISLAGVTAANASGTCSSYGSYSGNETLTCKGTVKYTWQCSSDLFGTWNSITHNFGSTYTSYTFRACNIGSPVHDYWTSV